MCAGGKDKIGNEIKIKWFGTATFLVEHDGAQLLFDPFIPLNKELYKPPVDELAAVNYILVTHGHFDHMSGVPTIIKNNGCYANVYCDAKPREKLITLGVEGCKIKAVAPGDVLSLQPFEIKVLKGKHIVFDTALLIKKLSSFLAPVNWNRLGNIFKLHKTYNEIGEILVYDVRVQHRRILFFGSLNMDGQTEYEKGADLLVLPLQGRSDIHAQAMRIALYLQPKKLMLIHFDNSFPPLSSSITAESLISLMRSNLPDVEVICPFAGISCVT